MSGSYKLSRHLNIYNVLLIYRINNDNIMINQSSHIWVPLSSNSTVSCQLSYMADNRFKFTKSIWCKKFERSSNTLVCSEPLDSSLLRIAEKQWIEWRITETLYSVISLSEQSGCKNGVKDPLAKGHWWKAVNWRKEAILNSSRLQLVQTSGQPFSFPFCKHCCFI